MCGCPSGSEQCAEVDLGRGGWERTGAGRQGQRTGGERRGTAASGDL